MLMDDVQSMSGVKPPLSSVRLMNDVTGLQDVTPLSFQSPKNYVQPLYIKNIKPEVSNSLLDLILSPETTVNLLDKYGIDEDWAAFLPFTVLVHLYNAYVDPLVRNGITSGQGWKEVGLNSLQSISEDLDVFANIVKSQMPLAGGEFGSLETLEDSLGLNGTRKVYNFNTGSTVGDITLEILADPLTWISIGTTAAAKNSAATTAKEVGKAATKELAERTAKEVTEEVLEEGAKQVTKQLSKRALKEFSRKLTKFAFTNGPAFSWDVFKKTLTAATLAEIEAVGLDKIATRLVYKALQSKGYKTFLAATKIKQVGKKVGTAINTIAKSTTPVGAALQYVVTPLTQKAFNHIYNFTIDKLKKYDLFSNFIKKQEAYRTALDTAIIQNNGIHESVFKDNADFLRWLGINETEFQNICYILLQQLDSSKANADFADLLIDYLNEHYNKNIKTEWLKYLTIDEIKHIKNRIGYELNQLGVNDPISRATSMQNAVRDAAEERAAKYETRRRLFYELIQAGTVAPAAIIQAQKDASNLYIGARLNTIKNYFETHQKNLEQTYRYIDEKLLNYQGKHYGLKDINGFITALLQDPRASFGYKQNVANLLEITGINTGNAKRIADVLNSSITNKNVALKQIIEETVNKDLVYFKDYQNMYKNVFKQVNTDTARALNEVWEEKVIPYNAATYKEIINTSLKNIKQAVINIDNNKEIQRSLAYIKKVVRLQELPDIETLNKIENLIKTQTDSENIISKFIVAKQDIIPFLEQTDKLLNTLDTDLSNASLVKSWYTEVTNLAKDLPSTIQMVDKIGPYGVQLNAQLRKLHASLNAFLTKDFSDDISNYVDNIKGMVQPTLSHARTFDIVVQHTHYSDDPATRFFLEQMANKQSVYRTTIVPNIIKWSEQTDTPVVANQLKKVVASIDTVNNLVKLKNSELATSFKLSSNVQKTIKNIVYDAIENHKDYLIADIITDELTDPTQYVYTRLKYSEVDKETFEALEGVVRTTPRQKLINEIDARLKEKAIFEHIMKDTVGLDPQAVMQEIKTQAHDLLNRYIRNQTELLSYVDNVSLSTLYDENTIDILNLVEKLRYTLAAHTDNLNMELINQYDTLTQDLQRFATQIDAGWDTVNRINKQIGIPIDQYKAKQQFQQLTESYNLLSASLESSHFTAKYLMENSYDYTDINTGELKHHAGFEEIFKLTSENFNGTNEELILLQDKLMPFKDFLHEKFKYEDKYIDKIRATLIDVYSGRNINFAPKDPIKYFNSLDKEALLAWEMATKNVQLSLKNRTRWYTYYKLHTQNMNIKRYTEDDLIARLNSVTLNNGFIDDYELAEVASIARKAETLEYVTKIVDANFMSTLHDFNDLGANYDSIVKMLDSNVQDYNYITKEIHDIQNTINIKKDYYPYQNTDDLHKLTGVDYGYEPLLRTDKIMYADIASTRAMSIAQATPEEIAGHIYYYTPGGLVFHNNHIIRTEHVDGSVSYEPIKNIFNFSKEELNKAGLKMEKVTDENGDWYHFRLVDHRDYKQIPKYLELPDTNIELHKRYADLINKYRLYLNMYENKGIPDNLITVEALNEDTWNMYMEKYEDFFGDIEKQKLYQKFTPQGVNMFFDKSYSRLNLAVIGGYDTYNIWNSINPTFIPRSTEMSSNTLAGLTAAINRSNKIVKYLTMIFNNDWSLDNPLLVKMFENATDLDIKQFFKENKYKVAILRADRKNLPKIWEFKVNNRRSLDKAIAAGGILVPIDTYNAMTKVINDRKMTNSLLDIYRRVVPSTYKSMYLYTAGFLFRNFLDSMVFKNLNELGGAVEAPELYKYTHEASKALELHNKIQQEILAYTNGETYNKDAILKILSKHTKEEAEIFFFVDLFRQSSASGGFSKSLSSWLENYNKTKTVDLRPLWEKVYEDDILFAHTETYPWTPEIKAHPLNPLAHTRNINSHIEDTARMALFLASVDQGIPINDAIARVVKTHFNYEASSSLMKLCERIFWFSTFPINNFNYYLYEGLTKSPSMLRILMDVQTASWNNGEYTYEELKKTNFLAYHALTGNMRIGNWIIKTSPSVFDFFGLVTDPVGNIKDRLNPFISIAVGNTDNVLNELNPLQTQFRLFPKQFQGNPVPSILSQINDYNWTPTLGKWRNSRKTYSGKWTTYPKIRKPRVTHSYLRHYYSRRYKTNVRKLTRTSLYHDLPRYYRLGGRKGNTYRDL